MLNGSCKKKIVSFASLLDSIEVEALDSSPYSKRYLQHLLSYKYYYLAIYAHVLDSALEQSNKPINELSLLDFGAGNGLLGMFARYCGFKKVFLCDINPNFVHASALVAEKLDIPIDGFIAGELPAVRNELKEIPPDIIAGTDVIEHIYNLDEFFAEIKSMNPEMITVFTTASNPDNYLKVKKLRKLQAKDELEGGDPEDFALAGEEKHAAYLDIRKGIISENFPRLDKAGIAKLAEASRGLRRPDIIDFVNYYLANGSFLSTLADDFNTCHPETGSWSERILPVIDYQQLYARHGFLLTIKNGFYNSFDGGARSVVNYFMNLLIKLLGKKTAPFITLTGFPQK